jgi:hypothetical protein
VPESYQLKKLRHLVTGRATSMDSAQQYKEPRLVVSKRKECTENRLHSQNVGKTTSINWKRAFAGKGERIYCKREERSFNKQWKQSVRSRGLLHELRKLMEKGVIWK